MNKTIEEKSQFRRYRAGLKAFVRGLGWSVLIGALVALSLAGAFGLLSSFVLQNNGVAFDQELQSGVRRLENSWLGVILSLFSFVGGAEGVIGLSVLLTAILAWQRKFRLVALLVIMVVGGLALNTLFKDIFQRPRPTLENFDVAGITRPLSYSYPSAHATMSMCFFGLLAYLALAYLKLPVLRYLTALLMLLTVGMVGVSRVYFGFHYPTDILGGYILGGCWLASLLAGVSRQKMKGRTEQTFTSG